MEDTVIVLLVILFIVIGFIWNRWPMWLTAMVGLMALVLTGILSLSDAFAGFVDPAVILTAAIYVLTEGFLKTSVLSKISRFIPKGRSNERCLLLLFLLITIVFSQFMGSVAIICILYPILLLLEKEAGLPTCRFIYPIILISHVWGAITPFGYGASTPYLFNAILEQFGAEPSFQLWDWFIGTIPMACITLIFLCTCGFRFLPKAAVKSVDESGLKEIRLTESELSRGKEMAAYLIFLGTIFMMIVGSFVGLNVCVVAVVGALCMVGTGILKSEEAFQAICWPIVFMIAAILPLAGAMSQTGAGDAIAHWIQLAMGSTRNPYVVQAVFFFLPAIMTQLMSNVATDRIIEPMAIVTAISMDISPLPVLIASAFGAGLSMLTPLSSPGMALGYALGGYDLKSFFRAGIGPFLCCALCAIFLVPMIYPF
ncbi:SLC13 family permease [Hominifimenecus sp. rT4P-3]|uniref:SLC13 family permease n=1 Tax=Hominifimenecus sp. rT4P-3 TaxID=3242979 RepID=UPI003DA4D0F2